MKLLDGVRSIPSHTSLEHCAKWPDAHHALCEPVGGLAELHVGELQDIQTSASKAHLWPQFRRCGAICGCWYQAVLWPLSTATALLTAAVRWPLLNVAVVLWPLFGADVAAPSIVCVSSSWRDGVEQCRPITAGPGHVTWVKRVWQVASPIRKLLMVAKVTHVRWVWLTIAIEIEW